MIVLFSTVTLLQVLDFETDDGGLQPTIGVGQWEYGTFTTGLSDGRMGGRQFDRNYLNDSYDALEVPLPDLSAALPQVEVEHWFDILSGDWGRLNCANLALNG